ncbi:MAG: pseudouridine-5'-phosphate glycosidase [Phycisphaerae bacterium]|nr:pseudouridine-5'-phosphate glycosidase [Phycisphaerae bacterium]
MSTHVQVHDEVANALQSRAGVVLLETAVLTQGLPHTPWQSTYGPCPPVIDAELPIHLATVQSMAAAIRSSGAVPAITAVINGTPRVGLTEEELNALAQDTQAGKASTPTLSLAMATGSSAGTTVSGTLRLSGSLASMGLLQPRVFATGGIGGVHTGWPASTDISADLGELARQQVCVVCAGAKSIIDARTTTEILESMGVPTLGFRVGQMPQFQSPPASDSPEIHRVDHLDAIAAIAKCHWSLPTSGGLLVCQSPPPATAMQPSDVASVVAEAQRQVRATGPARTPALLDAMASLSEGATLRANVDLLVSNANLAGELAMTMNYD